MRASSFACVPGLLRPATPRGLVASSSSSSSSSLLARLTDTRGDSSFRVYPRSLTANTNAAVRGIARDGFASARRRPLVCVTSVFYYLIPLELFRIMALARPAPLRSCAPPIPLRVSALISIPCVAPLRERVAAAPRFHGASLEEFAFVPVFLSLSLFLLLSLIFSFSL